MGLNIDTKTRTLRVELDLDADKSDARLLPGMGGSAAVAVGERRGVLSIPTEALWAQSGGVLTVVDDRAVPKPIKLAAGSSDRTEVISGLEEGDLVITGLADSKQKRPDWQKHPRVEIVEPESKE